MELCENESRFHEYYIQPTPNNTIRYRTHILSLSIRFYLRLPISNEEYKIDNERLFEDAGILSTVATANAVTAKHSYAGARLMTLVNDRRPAVIDDYLSCVRSCYPPKSLYCLSTDRV